MELKLVYRMLGNLKQLSPVNVFLRVFSGAFRPIVIFYKRLVIQVQL